MSRSAFGRVPFTSAGIAAMIAAARPMWGDQADRSGCGIVAHRVSQKIGYDTHISHHAVIFDPLRPSAPRRPSAVSDDVVMSSSSTCGSGQVCPELTVNPLLLAALRRGSRHRSSGRERSRQAGRMLVRGS